MKPVPVRFFFIANEVEETRSRRRFGQRSRFLAKKQKSPCPGFVFVCLRKSTTPNARPSVDFRFAQEKPKPGRFLFSQRAKKKAIFPIPPRAFSRRRRSLAFRETPESTWKTRENVGKRGTALFAQTRGARADAAPMRRATLPSVARAGRVRAVRARAGLDRTPGVPSTSIVANVSRSSCVAVSERRACAVFDRSVRRDPEASFRWALAIFCALKCAMNARGGACERGGAITVGREATIAADWTRRSRDPAGAYARQREWRGEGARGPSGFFSQVAFWRAPLDSRIEKNGPASSTNCWALGFGEVEKIWKSAARRQEREK